MCGWSGTPAEASVGLVVILMATTSLALPIIRTPLTVVVAGAVAVIAIGRVVVAAIAGPVALLVAVALVPVAAVALIPTLTLTCGGSRAQGPRDHLAHAGARMEKILPFGWWGYYGNSRDRSQGTAVRDTGPWART